MKTEKELKDELEDIFFDALTDKSNPPYYTDKVDPENDGYWQWKVYELCADELIKRGYGDISEYKAEIERLKDEIICLERKIAIRDNALKDRDKAIEMLEGKQDTIVKQAKIDVLNELKDKMFEREYMGVKYKERIFYGSEIDDMIAEVQNGKDKG